MVFVPRSYWLTGLAGALALLLACPAVPASRIKDLTAIGGVRDNQLSGYGLVIGLAGDGDGNLSYTVQSVANMLREYGINVPSDALKADNVAAVIVTADIPAFTREGTRIDVTVSSMGDADTLQGGTLLQTPLQGADGKVYAVAQGAIAVGGFLGGVGGPGGATVQKNHPTVGTIPGGAIVEREIPSEIDRDGNIDLILTNPDFTTAVRIADAINQAYPAMAQALDPTTVSVRIPEKYYGQTPNYIAALGALQAVPDQPARVVINEKTGTVVVTSDVRVSTVAISHGSLTITIASNLNVSQPEAFGEGRTAVTPSTETKVTEMRGGFRIVNNYPTLDRLTAALNALGVSTREMMSILQALKAAGALQAELELD